MTGEERGAIDIGDRPEFCGGECDAEKARRCREWLHGLLIAMVRVVGWAAGWDEGTGGEGVAKMMLMGRQIRGMGQ